jgi:hypothetical protein
VLLSPVTDALNFDVLDHALSDEIYAVLGVKKH